MQNSPQAQPQNSSQQVSMCPVTPSPPLTPMSSQHQQQKHHLAQHGFSRNPGAGGLTNQTGKQRQRQPQQRQYQQPSRQHPSQPQHVQSQQQGKVLKGIGRGNMAVHQNRSVDPTHLNGLSVPPGSQTVEKGDQVMQMMQGQNHYPGSALNPNPPSKSLGTAHSSNHSQLQQKLQQSGPTNTSSKQLQPVLSTSDSSIQGQASPTPSAHMTSPTQPSVIASNHHQLQLQSQPQSKQINQNQSNVQRMLQQNTQVHSESANISQSDPPKVNQQPANSASQFSTNSAMSQGCMDSAGELTTVPTASSQCKTSEPLYDSSMSNLVTQVNSLGGTPVGNSAGNEPPNISQGVVSRPLSTGLPSQAHNAAVQWQQQPLPAQQKSSTQSVLSQQPYQPAEMHQHLQQQQQQQQDKERHSPKDVAVQLQPQQQVQHLQPGQSSLLIRSPNSEVE
ncbi:hypothetical protein PIB30_118136 [Stylosanthes scabra]|nr:hypothetical protein [Stylosanthes scabra]